jgi:hypothetical protein
MPKWSRLAKISGPDTYIGPDIQYPDHLITGQKTVQKMTIGIPDCPVFGGILYYHSKTVLVHHFVSCIRMDSSFGMVGSRTESRH